ncbi:MAG TPA: PQQ-dependent sugar dehydrogenase [Gemmatimonadaceae bacterium]
MNKTTYLLFSICLVSGLAAGQNRLPAGMRPPGCTSGLQLPEGFCATLFADNVRGARHIVVAPNGDVFVNVQGNSSPGVLALRDTNRDGKADLRQSFAGAGGTGIALEDNFLYATSNNSIVRYRVAPSALAPFGRPDTIVTDLPMSGSHHSHNFVVHNHTLYVNIGSASNACQQQDRRASSPGNNPCTELNTRAGIWEFDANRLRQRPSDGRRYATGLRNSVAFTRNPLDGNLYATVHGRDQLHDNWPDLFTVEQSAENPGEELVRVDRGADYGWPYCYYDVDRRILVQAPEYGGNGRTTGQCASKVRPLMAFPGHWAPDGMLFYTGGQFPASYRGGAFIAFHGSWNRAPLPQAGFRVVFAPFRFNRPVGTFTTFADGFNPNPAPGRASPGTRRPTGIALAPDGSLFVTDDTGGTIWKITYRGTSR